MRKWGPEQGGGTRGGCSANDWGGQLLVRVPARAGLATEERRTAGKRSRARALAPGSLAGASPPLPLEALPLASLWSLHVWLRTHVSLVGGQPPSEPSNARRSSA